MPIIPSYRNPQQNEAVHAAAAAAAAAAVALANSDLQAIRERLNTTATAVLRTLQPSSLHDELFRAFRRAG